MRSLRSNVTSAMKFKSHSSHVRTAKSSLPVTSVANAIFSTMTSNRRKITTVTSAESVELAVKSSPIIATNVSVVSH